MGQVEGYCPWEEGVAVQDGGFSFSAHMETTQHREFVMTQKDSEKIALIVGGSRGIGRAIALRLARAGFDVWLTYHSNHEAAESVAREVEAMGRSCDRLSFDVANLDATKEALESRASNRPPDAVVFNAGIARDNLLVFMNKKDWDDVLTTNLDGFYNVMHAILFPMLHAEKS